MRERMKVFVLGSLVGGISGLLIGGTLSALFWGDVTSALRKVTRRLFGRDEQINFEILLQ